MSPNQASGRLPGEGADGGDHAAVILEVVVAVEDVVLAVVLVLDRHVDGGEPPAHRVGRRRRREPRGRRRSPTRRGRPSARSSSVRHEPCSRTGRMPEPYPPGGGPEDAGVGVARGPHRVVGSALVEAGDQADGVVEEGDQVGEGVAEEAGDAQRDVDAGPAELRERDGLEADDPPGLRLPDGPDAEQGEGLGHVVALRAHGRGTPQHQPDGARAARPSRPRGGR